MSDNVLAVGLFWRNDLGCASVVPSEQTSSSYIILDKFHFKSSSPRKIDTKYWTRSSASQCNFFVAVNGCNCFSKSPSSTHLPISLCLLFLWIKRWNHSGCGLPLPADQRSTRNGHQSLRPWCSTSVWPNSVLPAQRRTLNHIIMAFTVVFVGEQRRDTYYRNDPSEYDLEVLERQGPSYISYMARVCLWVLCMRCELVSWWQRWHVVRCWNKF